MFIPDPGLTRSLILITEFKYFYPKNGNCSQIKIRDVHPGFPALDSFSIPEAGVKSTGSRIRNTAFGADA
jgi:hypothetical protein